MTGRPLPRTCPGCTWKFTPQARGEVYCSGICAGRAAFREVFAALERFARSGASGG